MSITSILKSKVGKNAQEGLVHMTSFGKASVEEQNWRGKTEVGECSSKLIKPVSGGSNGVSRAYAGRRRALGWVLWDHRVRVRGRFGR